MRTEIEAEKLVTDNLRLAHSFANSFPESDRDEALSKAMAALLSAAQQWDQSVPFGSYASFRIKWAIKSVLDYKRGPEHISLQAPIGPDTDTELYEIIPDDKSTCPASNENLAILQNLTISLADRERDILMRRYGMNGSGPMTQEDLALEFGLTKQRICQIERAAILKLRRIARQRRIEWQP